MKIITEILFAPEILIPINRGEKQAQRDTLKKVFYKTKSERRDNC